MKARFVYFAAALLGLTIDLSAQIDQRDRMVHIGIDAYSRWLGQPSTNLRVVVAETPNAFQYTTNDPNLGSQTWSCDGNFPSVSAAGKDRRLTVALRAGQIYYLHLAYENDTSRRSNLRFDVPQGYQVLVNGTPTEEWSEIFFRNRTRTLEVRYTREKLDVGTTSGFYAGEEFLMDVGLGTLANGQHSGIFRIKRSAFLSGIRDRRIIQAQKRFGETFLRRESAFGASGVVRQIKHDQALFDFVDLTAGNGFKVNIYDGGGASTDPETGLFEVAGLTVRRSLTFTFSGSGSIKRIDLEDSHDGLVTYKRLEYTGAPETWIISEGKSTNDGSAWLYQEEVTVTPQTLGGVAVTKESTTVKGWVDSDLDGAKDGNESIQTVSTRDIYYREVALTSSSRHKITNGPIKQIVKDVTAPSTSYESSISYTFHNNSSNIGSYGKIQTLGSTGMSDIIYSYYDGSNPALLEKGLAFRGEVYEAIQNVRARLGPNTADATFQGSSRNFVEMG